MSLDVVQRGQLVKDKNGCRLCLSLSHVGVDECPLEAMPGKCSVDGCDESHSSMVHGCHIAGISTHARSTLKNITMQSPDVNPSEIVNQYSSRIMDLNQNVLLIKVKKTTVIAFWDTGSTISLICKTSKIDWCSDII
jgi:hypothetical protein